MRIVDVRGYHTRAMLTHALAQRSPVTKYYLGKSRQERNDHLSKLSQSNRPLSVATGAAYLRT